MRQVVSMALCGSAVAVLVVTALAQTAEPTSAADSRVPTQNCTNSRCHMQIRQHRRLHEPVATNRCDACHEPKERATPFQAGPRHEFKRAGDNPELCYGCHDRLTNHGFVHKPVKMGVCVLCHDPHGAEHPSLLRVETDQQLCAQCHRVTFDRGKHIHPPVADGTCSACHNPHGSDHRKFLSAAPPELCLDCHEAIEELLDDATVAHDAVTTGRSCLGCHNPHVSDVERLLIGDPMELCLSCHDKELDSDGGKIRNIAEHLKLNPDHHGPIRDGNCVACHNPHGGTIHRLLTEAYPEGPYAAFDENRYALCLGCHEVEMVEEERDDEATEFRNGDSNLHYVHVNREKQGITCGVCHDVHASKVPKHMVNPGDLGEQAMLVSFEPTATGGSCATRCHEKWGYDRDNPIANK